MKNLFVLCCTLFLIVGFSSCEKTLPTNATPLPVNQGGKQFATCSEGSFCILPNKTNYELTETLSFQLINNRDTAYQSVTMDYKEPEDLTELSWINVETLVEGEWQMKNIGWCGTGLFSREFAYETGYNETIEVTAEDLWLESGQTYRIAFVVYVEVEGANINYDDFR
ncbi:MAG: hypothetical protein ACPGXL_02285, partial [Chitinophagales bacterium]